MVAARPLALALALVLLSSPCRAAPTLAVSASVASSSDGSRSAVGMVVLTLPLDRAAAPSVPFLAQSPSRPPPARAPQRGCALTPAFARATVKAARRAARSGRAHARLESLASRAKSAAYLPELRLGAERSFGESLRLSPTVSDPYRTTHAGSTTTSFRVRATWRLDRLLFDADELAVERLRGTRVVIEARLVQRVLDALFAWHRGLRLAADTERLDDERVQAAVSAEEAEATLDVLTDGWFGPRAAIRRRACSD